MYFRLSVPEVIRFNRSNYEDEHILEKEEDVGPEIMHIYQVIYRKLKYFTIIMYPYIGTNKF